VHGRGACGLRWRSCPGRDETCPVSTGGRGGGEVGAAEHSTPAQVNLLSHSARCTPAGNSQSPHFGGACGMAALPLELSLLSARRISALSPPGTTPVSAACCRLGRTIPTEAPSLQQRGRHGQCSSGQCSSGQCSSGQCSSVAPAHSTALAVPRTARRGAVYRAMPGSRLSSSIRRLRAPAPAAVHSPRRALHRGDTTQHGDA
jgi:hypothetical protein